MLRLKHENPPFVITFGPPDEEVSKLVNIIKLVNTDKSHFITVFGSLSLSKIFYDTKTDRFLGSELYKID